MSRWRLALFGAAVVAAAVALPARPALLAGPPSMTRPQLGQQQAPGMWWLPNAAQVARRANLDYLKLARQTAFANSAECPGCPSGVELAQAQALPGGQGLYRLSGQAPITVNGAVACPAGQQVVVLRDGSLCASWLLWNGFVGYETVLGVANGGWLAPVGGLPPSPEPPSSACDVQQWYQSPDRSWGVWTTWRWSDGLSAADVAARAAQGWSSETADWSPDCASVGADGTRGPGRYLVRSGTFGQPPAAAQLR